MTPISSQQLWAPARDSVESERLSSAASAESASDGGNGTSNGRSSSSARMSIVGAAMRPSEDMAMLQFEQDTLEDELEAQLLASLSLGRGQNPETIREGDSGHDSDDE
jgi:hypothetical protein